MKSLNMQSQSSPSKVHHNPPKIVSNTPSDSNIIIDILNCSWVDNSHLQELIETKKPKMSDKAKTEFAASTLRDKLVKGIHAYPPSNMKMVYIQVCSLLDKKASMDFFIPAKKGKDDLVKLIWENCKKLRKIEYE